MTRAMQPAPVLRPNRSTLPPWLSAMTRAEQAGGDAEKPLEVGIRWVHPLGYTDGSTVEGSGSALCEFFHHLRVPDASELLGQRLRRRSRVEGVDLLGP